MAEFRTLVLWVHLVSVVLWMGGLFFYSFILLPMFGNVTPLPHAAPELLAKTLHRFIRYSKEIIGAVLLTGIFNIINSAFILQFQLTSKYLVFLTVKIIFVIIMITLHVLHSTRFAPQLAILGRDKNSDISEAFGIIKKRMLKSAIAMLLLFCTTMFIGLYLRYV